MLKRITLLLLTLTLVFGGLMTAHALDQEEVYTALQEELLRYLNGEEGAMPLDTLATQFNNLGRYKKSPLFGYYTSLLRDAEAGDTSRLELYTRLLRLDADFCAMLPESGFPTVDEVEAHMLGRQAEEMGDWNAAIGYYEQSIAVLDSMTRIMNLLTATPTPSPTPQPTPTPTPAPRIVAEDERHGDYLIDVYSDGTCAITGYTGNASTIVIPETIGWYPVTKLDEYAFRLCYSAVSISIPNTVTSIELQAFAHCSNLTSVSIPNSVTYIGDDAFWGCNSLASIYIPNSVTSIGPNPFLECHKLTDIRVSPDHPVLAVIDGVLFNKAEKKLICYPIAFKASSYSIPYGTEIIGQIAFAECDSLTSVSIPDSVTTIEHAAFMYCDGLTSIVIPNSVTTISSSVFHNCNGLISVSLPDNDISISMSAFKSCDSLTSFIVDPAHPVLVVVDGVLFNRDEYKLLRYPGGIKNKSYSIFDGIRIIGSYAFSECDSLTSISIPGSVTTIEECAFYECDGLTSVTIPFGVTTIDHGAFGWCDRLTSVTLPESVVSINRNAFYDSPNLTLRVPANSYAHQYAIENNIPYTTY